MTQFLLALKACSHRVSVLCKCDVFSNKGDGAIFLDMISKNKTARHASELQ